MSILKTIKSWFMPKFEDLSEDERTYKLLKLVKKHGRIDVLTAVIEFNIEGTYAEEELKRLKRRGFLGEIEP